MKNFRSAAAVVAAAFLFEAASAEPLLERGARELSVHISPDFEGAIGDMIFAQTGYGIFLRDRFQVRGTFAYTLLEDVAGEDSDYRMSEFGLACEYHFDLGNLVPYFGAGVGWSRSQFAGLDESALVYGPRAGLKYFLADNVALDLEATYKLSSADVFINDFKPEDSDLSVGFGLRVLLGRHH